MMRTFLIIVGIIAIIAFVAFAAFVIVPIIMISDTGSQLATESMAPGDIAAAKPRVLEFCKEVLTQAVPDPAKSDQVNYACACVWSKAEPLLLAGRSPADVIGQLTKPGTNTPDTITQCALQVGLIQQY